MPFEPQRNASNLFQSSGEGRRTLAKMRGKLASSGSIAAANPVSLANAARRPIRFKLWVVAAAAFLAGLNYALMAHPDRILSALGAAAAPARELQPAAALSLDDQARFWAYALYDRPGLHKRYGAGGGAILNTGRARERLEHLLAGDLGNAVRNEITALRKTGLPAPEKAKPRPTRG